MSVLSKNYTLNNGVEIPKLGLGTWFIDDADAAYAVRTRATVILIQRRLTVMSAVSVKVCVHVVCRGRSFLSYPKLPLNTKIMRKQKQELTRL